jgi:thimet oligopeptidase
MTLLEMPASGGAWIPFLDDYCNPRVQKAREALIALKSAPVRGPLAWVMTWNEGDAALTEARTLAELIAETHPDKSVRSRAEALLSEAKVLGLERLQESEVYATLAALDAGALDAEAAEVVRRLLGDFKAQGAHLDGSTRERLAALNIRITALTTRFSEHIRDAVATISVPQEALAGLPQDYIDAHPVGADGLVTITTDYPDLLPFLDMAHDHAARLALTLADGSRAYPENEPVLRELLDARHLKATLLGFQDYPTYATDAMMMPDGDGIGAFLDEVAAAAKPAGLRDVAALLEIARRDRPELTGITAPDTRYYIELLKAELHGVDQHSVRSYLRYERVRDGILALMTDLFGAVFVPAAAATWHPDVETYDVVDHGSTIGRIHLDMHPREGKFGHAACFGLVPGLAGRALPESVLVCNFSRGLLTHDELETFLHEFGHLIHAIFAGHHPYATTAGFGDRWEWDFIEAPSQLLEEWAWDADTLRRFAVNDAGEPIPSELVAAMRAARYTAASLLTCRQLSYGALSYKLHRDHPTDIDALADAVESEYDVREPLAGTHDWASFGHLTDYASNYYTYQWSLSIARDLFTAFDSHHLMDPTAARRYREFILAPGGTKPAMRLIEDFLGRPYSTAAYQEWLASM